MIYSFTLTSQAPQWILGALGVIGQVVSILGAAYIVRIAGDALSVSRRLNAFKAESLDD